MLFSRYLPVLQATMLILLTINCSAQDSISDIEGHKYHILAIGTQTWMTDNLRTSKDAAGIDVEYINYLNDSLYGKKYGYLYSWKSAMNGSGEERSQGICPKGWHIPSDAEWSVLTDLLGGIDKAGKVMRNQDSFKLIHCFGGNYLPEIKAFSYIDQQAYFWTSSSFNFSTAWIRNIGANTVNVNRSTVPKKFCFSIRCLKD